MLTSQLSLALASLTTLTTAKYIQDITQAEFSKQIQSNERILAAFTSQSTDAKIASFNTLFASTAANLTTPFLRIDCHAETQLCIEQDINILPTIRYFSHKNKEKESSEPEMTRYRGPRTAHALHSFVLKRELPTITYLENAQDLQPFKAIDTLVMIAYIRPDQTSLQATFRSIAEQYHTQVVFAYCTDPASADEERVSVPSIVLYKNDDGDNKVISGHFAENDVEGLIEAAGESVIGVFRERDMESFMVVSRYLGLPGSLSSMLTSRDREINSRSTFSCPQSRQSR